MTTPDERRRAQELWTHVGATRPAFAQEPGPGQESVWDYPRPPALVPDARHVVVRLGDVVVTETRRALRVLETASPPTFYLPRDDVDAETLVAAGGGSFCEWKGAASYWHVEAAGRRVEQAAWSYEAPSEAFRPLAGHISVYPAMLACFVDGERVRPQPGDFYGGWITSEIVGPFKGEPGTSGW